MPGRLCVKNVCGTDPYRRGVRVGVAFLDEVICRHDALLDGSPLPSTVWDNGTRVKAVMNVGGTIIGKAACARSGVPGMCCIIELCHWSRVCVDVVKNMTRVTTLKHKTNEETEIWQREDVIDLKFRELYSTLDLRILCCFASIGLCKAEAFSSTRGLASHERPG